MEQWKQDRLIDILDTLIDYRGKTPNKVECGIPLITAKIVKNGRIETPTEFLTVEDYKDWMVRGYPQMGDVVITTEAPLGEVAQLRDDKIALAQRIVCLRGKEGVLDNTYLKYFLMSNIGQYRLKARETGTTVTGIKQSELKEVLIDYPNYELQQKIASILSSFDSKIELNRRINDNLEQQAQALFDHYFDSGSIYLEDSIMGCLTDIAVYLNGLAMQKFPATDIERSLPVLKIKELGQRKCDDCSDRCSDSIDADYIIDNEDIIFSWSGTLMVDVWCGGKCGLNQHLFKVTPLKNYPRWFVYYWTNRHLKKFKLIAKDKAVTMGHIRRGDLENAEVAIPTNLNMLEINARINPLFQSIIDRRLEITKLENIRDALLPKLMSGELTINEI